MALSLQKKPFPWFDDITGGKQAIFSCFGGTCSNGDLRRWQQSLLLKLWFEVIGILTELEILNDFFFPGVTVQTSHSWEVKPLTSPCDVW